jgi:hypothetical protein
MDSTCGWWRPKSHGCSFGHSPSVALDKWRHSFDPQLQKQNSEWHAPLSLRKNIASSHANWYNSQGPVLLHSLAG